MALGSDLAIEGERLQFAIPRAAVSNSLKTVRILLLRRFTSVKATD